MLRTVQSQLLTGAHLGPDHVTALARLCTAGERRRPGAPHHHPAFRQAAIHSEAAFGFLWLRGLRRFRPQPAPEHDSVYKQRWHASLQTTDGNAAGMNGAYRGGGA